MEHTQHKRAERAREPAEPGWRPGRLGPAPASGVKSKHFVTFSEALEIQETIVPAFTVPSQRHRMKPKLKLIVELNIG